MVSILESPSRGQLANPSSNKDNREDDCAIVFLHGFPDNYTVWDPIIERLAETKRRLLRVSLPYFGQDKELTQTHSLNIKELTHQILQSLKNRKVEGAILVGHDWGGAISWLMAAQIPNLVKHLIITNAPNPHLYSLLLKENTQQRAIFQYFEKFCEPGIEEYLLKEDKALLRAYRPNIGTSGCLSRSGFDTLWSSPGKLKDCLGIYRDNIEDVLGSTYEKTVLSCPVSVFWGKHDHSLVSDCGKLSDSYTSARFRFQELDGSHWAFAENADLFATEILNVI